MKTILATNLYKSTALEVLRSCVPEGFRLLLPDSSERSKLIEAVQEADYLLAGGRFVIDDEVLDQAPRLKMVQRTGVGLDSIDIQALGRRGIPLYVNQGINSKSVAEHALLLMLACLRNLPKVHAQTRLAQWDRHGLGLQTGELSAQTVGIVGMGNIGRAVASLLRPFGASILYTDAVRLPLEEEDRLGVAWRAIDELCGESDIVTLHCSLSETTRHLVCKRTLELMKDGVILINTARGGLVCEEDLVRAIEEGKVGGAGLDVFEAEPPASNNPLLQSDKVICTPHIGGVTRDSFYRMMQNAMQNIALFDAGELSAIESSRY